MVNIWGHCKVEIVFVHDTNKTYKCPRTYSRYKSSAIPSLPMFPIYSATLNDTIITLNNCYLYITKTTYNLDYTRESSVKIRGEPLFRCYFLIWLVTLIYTERCFKINRICLEWTQVKSFLYPLPQVYIYLVEIKGDRRKLTPTICTRLSSTLVSNFRCI